MKRVLRTTPDGYVVSRRTGVVCRLGEVREAFVRMPEVTERTMDGWRTSWETLVPTLVIPVLVAGDAEIGAIPLCAGDPLRSRFVREKAAALVQTYRQKQGAR